MLHLTMLRNPERIQNSIVVNTVNNILRENQINNKRKRHDIQLFFYVDEHPQPYFTRDICMSNFCKFQAENV